MNYSKLLDAYGCLPIHRVVAKKNGSDLLYMQGNGIDIDPHYLLLSENFEDITAVSFGYTGMVTEIESQGRIIAQRRNAYGHFKGRETLENCINLVYGEISSMDFLEPIQEKFDWTYEKLMSRFLEFNRLAKGHIIPDYNDTSLAIPIADPACINDCTWCQYARSQTSGFEGHPMSKVKNILEEAAGLVKKYHSSYDMNEVFFASPDIFLFFLLTKIDPIDYVKEFLDYFPNSSNYNKRSGFFGVNTGLELIDKMPKSFFTDLFSYITRAYVGIENLDDRVSFGNNKRIKAQDKMRFLDFLLTTPVQKIKAIVQVGIDPDEDLQKTAEGMAQFARKANSSSNILRFTVELSNHIPNRGSGELTEHELEQDKFKIFIEAFKKARTDIAALRKGYESALPNYGI